MMRLSSIVCQPLLEIPCVSDVELLRRLGRGFIWLGAPACGIHLLLALPSIRSFSGFLLTIADTIGRLSATVGLGAILLALTSIIEAFHQTGNKVQQHEDQVP